MRTSCRLIVCVFLLLWLGCAAPPSQPLEPDTMPRLQRIDDFIVVRTVRGDTFSNLAAKLLKDPSQGWLIAEFNDIAEVVPGQQLIIPLRACAKGGLQADGYQTVRVLTYHRFSHNKSGKLTITSQAFESQIRFLKENGFAPSARPHMDIPAA